MDALRTRRPADDKAIRALEAGTNNDPFAVLGPHRVDGAAGLIVRAYRPDAESIDLVCPLAGSVTPMRRRGRGNLFEIVIADAPADPSAFDYRLRIHRRDGSVAEIGDPYRYGRVLGDFDLHLFSEGTHYRAYEKFGAHPMKLGEASGVHFAVWAPGAGRVSVTGDFNGWDGRVNPMRLLLPQGVWEIFIPGLGVGERYKFEIRSAAGHILQKADPFASRCETPPLSASVVWDAEGYQWGDSAWMERRRAESSWLDRPMSVYEVHLGSWARVPEEGNRHLTYRELAEQLVPYVKDLGFTHVELLPVMEHPFAGSWGYQVIGFFAPTNRFGPPEDFKLFVDACHAHGLGVILDWVPGHFPRDGHGLARFDGTALYEHEDPRQGEHRDWGTLIFNYGRNEVRSFLLSNALFWLEEYHVDGLRVDAVASMLYLDYSREPGEWIPNRYGGRENLEAVEFVKHLNTLTHSQHEGSITAAEESTAWPAVSRPVHLGGLGFTYKWNMGWMHDILQYARRDPIYRKFSHNELTFSMLYAYHENFILPFSHDEVVHGKGSMLGKMPGDTWQKFATLRALYGFLFGHPGKKLLFMGNEIAQWCEWDHDNSLEWHLLQYAPHAQVQRLVKDLNAVYRREASLHQVDYDPAGFQWIDCHDSDSSIVSFIRRARDPHDFTVMVLNFTPVPRQDYRIGVPEAGRYAELINTDSEYYGGSNLGNAGGVISEPVEAHGHSHSVRLLVPPLACLVLKRA
jgi:1,4-alpha-glucan branching enzyme